MSGVLRLAASTLTLLACSTRAPYGAEPIPARRSAAAETLPAVWTPTATPLSTARAAHDAALLDSGHVLVCGGRSNGAATEYLDSCDVFSVESATFSRANSGLAGAAAFLSLTAADAGRVYAVGGEDPNTSSTYRNLVSLFSPAGADVGRAEQPALAAARSHHTASWLPVPRALVVVGGFDGDLVARDELAKPDSSGKITSFVAVAPASKRIYHSATVLASGNQLLVTGGGDPAHPDFISASVRLLTVPASGSASWSELTPLTGSGLAEHSATLLRDGRVFIAGGRPASAFISDQTLLYDASNGGTPSTALAPMSKRRSAHAAILLHDKVIVTGGETPTGISNSVEVYDPKLDVWYALAPMNVARRNHTITLLDDDRALVSGGIGADKMATDSAEILRPRLQGEPCDTGAQQCLTGHCVDGVCCDTACDGSCQRCDQSGKVGSCQSNVTGVPVGSRDCAGGLLCNNGACLSSCSKSEQCRDELFCKDGQCVPRLPLKSACKAGRDCAAGAPCVDGYCCDSQCDGVCESCGESSSPGKCVPVTGTPRGSRPSCGEPSDECGLACDGTTRDVCNYVAAGAGCGEDRCVDGRVTTVSACDGFGNCGSVPEDCKGAFACKADGASCRSDCERDDDCAGNAYTCRLDAPPGVCVFKADVGKDCKGDAECGGGLVCEDQVCCAEHCPDDSYSCALPGHAGICRKKPGESCVSPSDCGSGFCVLGVCCESECSGQCETCAAEGHRGECRPQTGDPEPRRPPCSKRDDFCAAVTCSGVDDARARASCTALRNVDESCEDARCEDNSFVPARRCSANGRCADATPQPCSLYACTSEGCTDSCRADTDCAGDAQCRDGQCVPAGAYCKDNQLVLRDGSSQDCSPYRCAIDRCPLRCESSEQCATGFACDDVSSTCTRIAGTGDDGCSCSLPGSRSPTSSWLLPLLVALGALRKRQRKSSAATALIRR